MKNEKILEAVDEMEKRLHHRFPDVKGKHQQIDSRVRLNVYDWPAVDFTRHVGWVLDQIRMCVAYGEREKALCWLGFAQCASLWMGNFGSIEELKQLNRPGSPGMVTGVKVAIDKERSGDASDDATWPGGTAAAQYEFLQGRFGKVR